MCQIMTIYDFPLYFCDSDGNIYSKYHNTVKKLKPKKNKEGYLWVVLYKDKKHYFKRVNRIIAQTFIPNPNNKPEVNHKNGIRDDNRVENLEWATRSENCLHKFRILGYKPHTPSGADHPSSKPVLQISNSVVVAEFESTGVAFRTTGINRAHIISCCGGKRKTAGGYHWQYKKE